ncbi:MAG: hypothetical protein D6803_01275 [Anaerolineae bacterium]|nr:MAG: hypothetical protein D6803_01275 [Anaerolineae bacterium]
MFALLACSLFTQSGSEQAAAPAAPATHILFQDDFADRTSGWGYMDVVQGITDYENGIYRIRVDEPEYDLWATPGLTFDDVRIEVEATKAAGPDDNRFGLICRHQDVNNFYVFYISSDGYYGLGKVQDGVFSLLGMDELLPHDAIRQGAATNHIQADCLQNRLSLYVNGTLLGEASDDAFSSGEVGVIAGAYGTGGVDIHFDNFIVRAP